MKILQNKIKTTDDYKWFCKILLSHVEDNISISNKPMLDGMIIYLIINNPYSENLFLNNDLGYISDYNIQQLEQIIIWCKNNEKKLLKLIL